MIFKTELNLYAFVGVIMLVGLVKKNGIMMVDFAVEAQRQGKTPAEAIHEACLVRFRPIMMTTMAALVGTLPIALGLGRRRRVAAAARPGGRRRPGRLAAADALHHAGLLRLHRGRPCPPDASSSRKGASGSPSRRALINGPTGRRGDGPVRVRRSGPNGPKVRVEVDRTIRPSDGPSTLPDASHARRPFGPLISRTSGPRGSHRRHRGHTRSLAR